MGENKDSSFDVKVVFLLALVAVAAALPRSVRLSRPSFETKIIGGEEAGEKEFPFQVILSFDFNGLNPLCSGVIYDETRIITSGACAVINSFYTIVVIPGIHDLRQINDKEVDTRYTVATIIHENYNLETYENDIGILVLDSPLVFSEKVQPIRLALNTTVTSGDVVTCGHGTSARYGSELTNMLQKATLKTISRDECTRTFESIENAPVVRETNICASGPRTASTSGDQGAPLVAKDDAGRDYLAGVSSFGAEPWGDYPSVFTEIAPLRSWLDSNLN